MDVWVSNNCAIELDDTRLQSAYVNVHTQFVISFMNLTQCGQIVMPAPRHYENPVLVGI